MLIHNSIWAYIVHTQISTTSDLNHMRISPAAFVWWRTHFALTTHTERTRTKIPKHRRPNRSTEQHLCAFSGVCGGVWANCKHTHHQQHIYTHTSKHSRRIYCAQNGAHELRTHPTYKHIPIGTPPRNRNCTLCTHTHTDSHTHNCAHAVSGMPPNGSA